MQSIPRRAGAVAALFALSACVSATLPADPGLVAAAEALRGEAAQFHAGLTIAAAPHCAYEQNKNFYDRFDASAAGIAASISARPALAQSGKALVRLVHDMRASHQAASADVSDAYGLCMAPGAIALNAGAIDRALAAIAASQGQQGGT